MVEGVSIGRIVHFVRGDGVELPAIIVKVVDKDSGVVNLQVFVSDWVEHGNNIFHQTEIKFSEKPVLQTWHWPERE